MSALAACVDALFTGGADAVGFLALARSAWGIGAPAFVAISAAFALLAIVVHPHQAPSVFRAGKWLREGPEAVRLARAIATPLVIVGAWVWTVACAHLGRHILSRIPSPPVAGVAIGVSATVVLVIVVVVVLALYAAIHSAISVRKQDVRRRFTALWTVPVALGLCVLMALWGLATGSTGGEGGLFGFMGVLRRIELDLRAPGMLLATGLGAYLAPQPRRSWLAPVALVAGLTPLVMLVATARFLGQSPELVTRMEQSSPLGRTMLPVLRKLTDRDRDGFSPYFGGGDCDDHNAAVYPLAVDIPGDGIDQDCSGKDLALADAIPAQPDPAARANTANQAATYTLAPDLNVLLITVDTLRWDMGFMNYPRPVSPAMDALAARSTVFEHTYAMSAYTGKAVGPMMSGKYPSETSMGWSHYNKYPPSDRMVQERLQKAGIYTLGIHCHWYFKKDTGIGRGFDLFDLSALPPQGIDATTDTSYSADRLSDAAIKVLSDPANTQKRFFAWIHYFDPHAEYLHHPGTEDFGRASVRDLYDHEVRWTDDQLKRVLDFVQQQPWAEKTAILITADHGEAFGEHGMYRHGFEVWDEVVRVPLIVYVPGAAPKRVKQKRSLIDLVPTILELMNVTIDAPEDDKDFLSGKSLLPDVFAANDAVLEEREILVDMPPGPFNQARRAYVREPYKLIIAGGVRYQLYHLGDDPGEKRNLADNTELLEQQREHYDRFRAKLKEVPLKPPK